jgi:hypothetical protein
VVRQSFDVFSNESLKLLGSRCHLEGRHSKLSTMDGIIVGLKVPARVTAALGLFEVPIEKVLRFGALGPGARSWTGWVPSRSEVGES